MAHDLFSNNYQVNKLLRIIMKTYLKPGLLTAVLFLTSHIASAQQDQRIEALQSYFNHCHQVKLCNGSFLVAEDDKVLFHQAMGSNHKQEGQLTTSYQYDIGSISKQFTAVAIMMLQEQGKLKFDDAVLSHLSDFPYANITIKQLLNHTSGLPDMMPYLTNLYRQGKVKASIDQFTIMNALKEQKPKVMYLPGEKWQYSNTGYVVLASLVSKISGQTYGDFLQKNIFAPLDMAHTVSRTSNTEHKITKRAYGFRQLINGQQRAYDQIPFFDVEGMGGIYSTTSDLYKWDQALFSYKLLSIETWKEATEVTKTSDGNTKQYGLGFMLKPDDFENKKVGHSGHWRGFKSIYSRQLANNRTIIFLTNNGQDDSVDANEKAIDAILANKPYEPLKQPISHALYSIFGNDIEKAVNTYHALKANKVDEYDFSENELNNLGYVFLEEKNTEAAIAIFKLNTKAYPNSANAFDSLAEALISDNQKQAAQLALEKALTIDPDLTSATKQLSKLKSSNL